MATVSTQSWIRRPGGYNAAMLGQLAVKAACVDRKRRVRRHLPERRLHPLQGPVARSSISMKPIAIARLGIKAQIESIGPP